MGPLGLARPFAFVTPAENLEPARHRGVPHLDPSVAAIPSESGMAAQVLSSLALRHSRVTRRQLQRGVG